MKKNKIIATLSSKMAINLIEIFRDIKWQEIIVIDKISGQFVRDLTNMIDTINIIEDRYMNDFIKLKYQDE
jgi:hypothetical protein